MLANKAKNRRGSFKLNEDKFMNEWKMGNGDRVDSFMQDIKSDLAIEDILSTIQENRFSNCEYKEIKSIAEKGLDDYYKRIAEDNIRQNLATTIADMSNNNYDYMEDGLNERVCEAEGGIPTLFDGGCRFMGIARGVEKVIHIDDNELLIVFHNDLYHLVREAMVRIYGEAFPLENTKCSFGRYRAFIENSHMLPDCIMELGEKRGINVIRTLDEPYEDWMVSDIITKSIKDSKKCEEEVVDYPKWWIDKGYMIDGDERRYDDLGLKVYFKKHGWITEEKYLSLRQAEANEKRKGKLIG